MVRFIPTNSKVIEFGCGKGDLLCKLSPNIISGLGIDKSISQINYAKSKQHQYNLSNIQFVCKELGRSYTTLETYQVSIASLFFHVIPRVDAIYLLNTMKTVSKTIIICGFSRPQSWQGKTLLWLDQMLTSHYNNFKAYKKAGFMEGLFAATKTTPAERYDTTIPFIKIYKINNKL